MAPPAQDGALNATGTLGYTLSETVTSASITATRTAGAADSTVHTCTLQGTALQAGARTVPLTVQANGCTQPLALVDGAVYTLAFTATDPAGHVSAPTSIAGVIYDNTAPTVTLTVPAHSTSRTIALTFSGADSSGSGVTSYCLHASNDSSACAWGSTPADSYTVAGDGTFTLHGFVRDRAGNIGTATSTVVVDTVKPATPTLTTTPAWVVGNSITIEVQGEAGSRIWVNGVNTGVILDAGTGKASITLDTSAMANGSSSTFQITLRDASGNISDTLALTLGRDDTAPVFSALSPAQDGTLNATGTLGYTLSETVASASITGTRTAGAAGATVHTCTLQGIALQAGARTMPLTVQANGCAQPLALVDGAVYTFAFAATDAAGNASAAASITGVTYDNTAPAVPTVIRPLDGSTGTGNSVTVEGTAEDGSRVEVWLAGTLKGQAVAAGGNYAIPVTGLPFAPQTFTITATDAAGNVSGPATLTYTAVPAPVEPPAIIVRDGSYTQLSGGTVTVDGPAQITTGSGGTVILTPRSRGTTVTLPPATGNDGRPVTIEIGGQAIQVQPQEGSGVTLSVVTLIGADGRPQVALALNPTPSGTSRVQVGGSVGAGTVVGVLQTEQGAVPITAAQSGPVNVVLLAKDSPQTAERWGVFVLNGIVQMPLPGASGTLPLHAGEVARLDGLGQLLGLRLGSPSGGGLGDAQTIAGLPPSVTENAGMVRLDGVPARWQGTQTLQERVAAALRAIGIPSTPVPTDGTQRWAVGSQTLPVVPLEVRVMPERPNDVTTAADGSIEVVVDGIVTRFGPSLEGLTALVRDVASSGGATQLAPNGSLRVVLGTSAFQVRPAWAPVGIQGQAPGLGIVAGVGLVFTGPAGQSQALLADVADYAALNRELTAALGRPVTVRTGLDTVTNVELDGQRFQLIPEAEMVRESAAAPAAPSAWMEGNWLVVRYPDGWIQRFAVLPSQ